MSLTWSPRLYSCKFTVLSPTQNLVVYVALEHYLIRGYINYDSGSVKLVRKLVYKQALKDGLDSDKEDMRILLQERTKIKA